MKTSKTPKTTKRTKRTIECGMCQATFPTAAKPMGQYRVEQRSKYQRVGVWVCMPCFNHHERWSAFYDAVEQQEQLAESTIEDVDTEFDITPYPKTNTVN